jgi:transcriptional regulator with PAS, ATPase and Fis domain
MIDNPSRRTFEECAVAIDELLAELQLCPGVGFAILDDQLRFQAVNQALAQMNGIPEIQHLGKTLADVLGDFEHQVSPLVREVLASRRPLLHCDLSGTLPTRRETGYWVGHYFPLTDCSGSIAKLGAVVLEVTTQRKVEDLLARFTSTGTAVDPTLEAVERDYIIHVLKKVNGKVAGRDGAAAKLGMKRTTLQSRLYKLGINVRDYKYTPR